MIAAMGTKTTDFTRAPDLAGSLAHLGLLYRCQSRRDAQ